jgi:hypothetical protein
MLDYEKLHVYRIALDFVITTIEIPERLSRGSGELLDQFKRASFSIERGSVMECGALSDLLNALRYVSPDAYRAGKGLLTRIAAMLSKLCLQLP